MTSIATTVGRIVYFSPDEGDRELFRKHAPFAAIIGAVHDDGTLNLAVIGKQCELYPRKGVPLMQGALVAEPERAYAMWMEYQRGAALARIDALEEAEARRQPLRTCSALIGTTPDQNASGSDFTKTVHYEGRPETSISKASEAVRKMNDARQNPKRITAEQLVPDDVRARYAAFWEGEQAALQQAEINRLDEQARRRRMWWWQRVWEALWVSR